MNSKLISHSLSKQELYPIKQLNRQSTYRYPSSKHVHRQNQQQAFTNKMLNGINIKNSFVQSKNLSTDQQNKVNTRKQAYSGIYTQGFDQSTRPATRNKSVNDMISNIRAKTAKIQTIASETNFSSKLHKYYSKKVMKGLTSASKPIIVLTKQQRNNPLGKPIKIKQQMINKSGLYKLINMGIIPKSVNLKQTLNDYVEIQKKKERNNKKQPDLIENQLKADMFITNGDIFATQNRRSTIKIQREDSQLLNNQIKQIKSNQICYLSLIEYEIIKDDNFNNFKSNCQQNGNWKYWNEYLAEVKKFSKKFKIKKLEFFPQFNFNVKKITESMILNSAKDSEALKSLILIVEKGSPEFQKFRQSKLNDFLRMIVCRIRFHKTLNQVKYINAIKRLYKLQKYQIEIKNKLIKTLNFKYEIFADLQRRIMQEQKYQNRRIVELHINSFKIPKIKRETYYKYHERLNIQITRIFSFIKPKTQVIYISPYQEINKQIQQFLLKLVNIHQNDSNQNKVTLFYSKKYKFLSNKSNPDQQFYYFFNKQIKTQIKKIVKGRMIRLVGSSISQIDIKISQLLNAASLNGTLTKQSISLLFDQQQQKSYGQQISKKFIFKKYNTLRKVQNDPNIQKQFKLTKQTYIIKQKVKKLKFAANCYLQKKQVRKFFKDFNLEVPIALQEFDKNNFYVRFAKLLFQNKEINLWIFKMNYEQHSRGVAYMETDSIKILNLKKKKGFITSQDLIQTSKILEIIIYQKLIVAHSSLYSRQQYMKEFLEVGGIVQACRKQATSPVIFVEITPNGNISILGSCRKINTTAFVNNLCLYPAPQLKQNQFVQVQKMCQRLYKEGIFGYISFQLLCYYNSIQKQICFEYLWLECHLNIYSSAYFLYTHLLKSIYVNNSIFSQQTQKYILYCPFLDNNGFKCKDIKKFYTMCKQNNISYDLDKKQGIIILLLGNDSSQVMSIFSIGSSEKTTIKHMSQCLNYVCNMGFKNSQFDKDEHNKKIDNFYSLDTIWKVRQLNRLFH